jgi:hypothetical protein
MFIWTLQAIFISVIFIFLIHNLFGFFKNTLTVPKIKDLVNLPSQNYENMFNILHKNKQANSSSKYNNNSDYDILPTNFSTTENPFYNGSNNATSNANSNDKLNQFDPSLSMKNELKNFFKKKMDNNADVKGGLALPKGVLSLPKGGLSLPTGVLSLPKDLLTLDNNSPNYSAYS